MEFVSVSMEGDIATVLLTRGKVNALIEAVIDEFSDCFHELSSDPQLKAVILTGSGKFFSFGFDIPHFMAHLKEDFTALSHQVH